MQESRQARVAGEAYAWIAGDDMNKIGIIRDIHCQDKKLEIAIDFLKTNTDGILCVGDIVDGLGDCNRCIGLLIRNKIIAVKGNHEKWIIKGEMRDMVGATRIEDLSAENIEYIKNLKDEIEIEENTTKMLLCHGIGKNDMACIKPDDYGYGLQCNDVLWDYIARSKYSIMIGGHTHEEMVRKIDGLTLINPGSMDKNNGSNFAIIDLFRNSVDFYSVDNQKEISKIKQLEIPES
jgi:putative phosphoesterase